MKKLLTNKQMAQAFGGYDYAIRDMREVCKTQRQLTLKEVGEWIEGLGHYSGDRLGEEWGYFCIEPEEFQNFIKALKRGEMPK